MRIFCNDGCLPALMVRDDHPDPHRSCRFGVYGISEVTGMGEAQYGRLLVACDEVKPFNSLSGTAFFAARRGMKWALARVSDNQPMMINSGITWMCDFTHADLQKMLDEHGVSVEDYFH